LELAAEGRPPELIPVPLVPIEESGGPRPRPEGVMKLVRVMVMVGHAKTRDYHSGVEGGSKTELKRINFLANGAVGWLFGNVLRLFRTYSMAGERSLWRNGGGGVRENMQLQSIVFSAIGYVHSSMPYHPRGVPIFPNRPKTNKQSKSRRENRQQSNK